MVHTNDQYVEQPVDTVIYLCQILPTLELELLSQIGILLKSVSLRQRLWKWKQFQKMIRMSDFWSVGKYGNEHGL